MRGNKEGTLVCVGSEEEEKLRGKKEKGNISKYIGGKCLKGKKSKRGRVYVVEYGSVWEYVGVSMRRCEKRLNVKYRRV